MNAACLAEGGAGVDHDAERGEGAAGGVVVGHAGVVGLLGQAGREEGVGLPAGFAGLLLGAAEVDDDFGVVGVPAGGVGVGVAELGFGFLIF